MNIKQKRILKLSFVGLSLFSMKALDVSATPNDNTETPEVIEKSMITEKEEEVLKLNSDISKKVIKKDELEKSIKNKTTEIEKNESELEKKIDLHNKRFDIAKERVLNLQAKDEGPVLSYVNALIKADGLTEAMGRVFSITTINESNDELMTELDKESVELEKLGQSLEKDKKQLEKDKTDLEVVIKQLGEQKKKAEAEEQILKEKWEKQEAEMKKLSEIQKKITEEAKKALSEQQSMLKKQEVLLAKLSTTGYTPSTDEQGILNNYLNQKNDLKTSLSILEDAYSYLGTPYVWGGATPSGFDCSGLVQWVYGRAGIELPRVSEDQSKIGEKVSFDKLEAGDLLYWGSEGQSYHVAIYIGNGKFVHAPKPGDSVKITKMEDFKPSFAKRVIPESKKATIPTVANKAVLSTDNLDYEILNGVFHSTYYSAYDGAQIGITAGGTNMSNGNIFTKDGYRIVAVDSSVIPLGTIMRVTTGDGQSFLAKADDTGSMIKGNRLDIAVSSKTEAFKLGTTTAIIERVTNK